MEQLLEHIGSHFLEYLVLFLLCALFFKESLSAFINAKLGFEENTPKWGRDATNEINRLAEYANHDTTERLEHIKTSLAEVNRTLKEIKEYGIPCRKK